MPGPDDAPASARTPAGPEPAPRRGATGMFAALSVPNFRRYVAGQSLSLIGTWAETVAQALLVLQLTHSGTILGLATAARYGPILLLSPSAGLLVDRYPKRQVLLATQAGLGLVSAVLGAAVLTGEIRLWQVVAPGGAVRHFQRGRQPGAASVRPGGGWPRPGPERRDA
jgi:MFS family permease